MSKCPDLHMHSTYSDGVLSPELLVYEAGLAGVDLMAITDHDTFSGSDQLRTQDPEIPVIAGVELSIKDMQGLHLLGYGAAHGDALRDKVTELALHRLERAKKMLVRLDELGMHLDWKVLERKYRGTVGRPHIARAMVHEGYATSMQDAFERFLGHGKPAYVPGQRLGMAEALELMRRSGFVPVLAHPYELNQPNELLVSLVQRWKDQGLMGMEVYHPSARGHGFDQLDRMARRMGLLVTGGSDFHQENDKHGLIGSTARDWARAEEDTAALLEALDAERSRVGG